MPLHGTGSGRVGPPSHVPCGGALVLGCPLIFHGVMANSKRERETCGGGLGTTMTVKQNRGKGIECGKRKTAMSDILKQKNCKVKRRHSSQDDVLLFRRNKIL